MDSTHHDVIEHIAVPVTNISKAVDWYTKTFKCQVSYQDESWAIIDFANIQLALVLPNQHPAHIAFQRNDADTFGPLKVHRDGTRSVYIADPSGNAVEILASDLST